MHQHVVRCFKSPILKVGNISWLGSLKLGEGCKLQNHNILMSDIKLLLEL